ncbi:MAG: zinc dependent phospholipase C family protein, partial [Deltaproteobacteria bacterium]|nr:zinc dependent phospholipase C family protein [Deltaproteobacteria bacterium]
GFLCHLLFPDGAWAWGPGVHAVTALGALRDAGELMPSIAGIITSFPREYMYGSFAADFFIGKSITRRQDHPHHWEGGFGFLRDAANDREAAFAYGFLSHLAADVIAHNFFVPNLLTSPLATPSKGHIYWEVKADRAVGRGYTRVAKEILSMEHQACDDLLNLGKRTSRNGLAAKKHFFTQTVKFFDYYNTARHLLLPDEGYEEKAFTDYIAVMVGLSCRLVKSLLMEPYSAPCIRYDPMGKRNLGIARRRALLSKATGYPGPVKQFTVAEDLLEL